MSYQDYIKNKYGVASLNQNVANTSYSDRIRSKYGVTSFDRYTRDGGSYSDYIRQKYGLGSAPELQQVESVSRDQRVGYEVQKHTILHSPEYNQPDIPSVWEQRIQQRNLERQPGNVFPSSAPEEQGFFDRYLFSGSKAVFGTMGQAITSVFRSSLDSLERGTRTSRVYEGNIFTALAKAFTIEPEPLSSETPVGQFRELESRRFQQMSELKDLVNMSSSVAYSLYQEGDTQWSQLLRPVEQSLADWANLDEQHIAVRVTAQMASVVPYLIGMKINPTAAFPVIFNDSYVRNIEEAASKGLSRTDPRVHIFASAEAGLRMVTLYGFSALKTEAGALSQTYASRLGAREAKRLVADRFGSSTGTALGNVTQQKIQEFIKTVSNQYIRSFSQQEAQRIYELSKPTLANFARHLMINVAERSGAEVVYNIGSGIIAHNTIMEDNPLYTRNKEDGGLITPQGLAEAGVSGAMLGFVNAAMSLNPSFFSKGYAASQSLNDKSIMTVTPKDYNRVMNEVRKDMMNIQASSIVLKNTGKAALSYMEQPPFEIERLIRRTPSSSISQVDTTMPAQDTSPTNQMILESPSGNSITMSVSPQESIDAVIKAPLISEIIPSIDADGNIVPEYNKSLQPRDTERADSKRIVNDIAMNPNYRELFRIESIQDGIPVVGENGMVVAGNHRVAGILKMMRDNPDGYKGYKEYAISNAEKLGLSKEQLQGDFIVTRMLPAGTNLVDIADKTNIQATRRMSPTETARRDSGKIDSAILESFVARDDGMINTAANRSFLQSFAKNVIPSSELNSYMDSDGNFNQDGIERVRNALFHRAYGSTRLLDLIAETTDNDVKRLTNSLVNVSPVIVSLDDGIKRGDYYNVPIGNLISKSAEQWVRMKQSGENVSMYANQVEMGDTPDIIREKNLLLAMDKYKGSAKQLTSFYSDIINAVKAAGVPGQIDLFNSEPPSLDTVIEVAKRRGDTSETQIELQPEASGVSAEKTKPAKKKTKRQESKNLLQRSDESVAKTEKLIDKAIEAENFDSQNSGYHFKPVQGDPTASILGEAASEMHGNQRQKAVPEWFRRSYVNDSKQKVTINNLWGQTNTDRIVKSNIEKAKTSWMAEPKDLKERISDVKSFFVRNFMRGAIPELDYKHGDIRFQLIRVQKRKQIASALAQIKTLGIYKPVPEEYSELMTSAVIFPDMLEDIKRGIYDTIEFPFGIPNKEYVYKKATQIDSVINDPSDPTVAKALSRRKGIFKAAENLYVQKAKDSIDMDAKPIFNRKNYYRHLVVEHLNLIQKDRAYRKSVTGSYKIREGTSKDFVTDVELADFIALQKMEEDMLLFDLMKTIRPYDKTKSLKINNNGERIIPDGYVKLTASDVGFNFPHELLTETRVAVAREWLKEIKISPTSKIGKKIMREARDAEASLSWVVPEDIRDSVLRVMDIKKPHNWLDIARRKAMQAWKVQKIMFPTRIVKYQASNISGDLAQNAVIAMGFKNLKEAKEYFKGLGESIVDLRNFVYNKQVPKGKRGERILQYLSRGGMQSHHSFQELQDERLYKEISLTNRDGSLKTAKQLAKDITRIWGAVENFYQYRENILRFAAFKYYADHFEKHNYPPRGYYAGSIKREIDSIKNPLDKAFKMTNDLNVAYDDVSPTGQFISQGIHPFWRFQEGNNRRVFRELKNLANIDPEIAYKEGVKTTDRLKAAGVITGKVTASAIWTIGKLMLLLNLVGLTASAWNYGVHGDKIKDLPAGIRNKNILIYGGNAERVFYNANWGSFQQALGWVGADISLQEIKQILSGEYTVEDKVKDIVDHYKQNFIYNSMPLERLMWEMILGKKTFPDIGAVRDPLRHAAQQLELGVAYDNVMGLPRRDGKALHVADFFTATALRGESSFWDIYSIVEDYLDDIGEPRPNVNMEPTERSKALYNFRTAIRLQDGDAAETWLKEYVLLGGTGQGLKTSVRNMDPTNFLSNEQKKNFLEWLSDEDKETVRNGFKFYAEMVKDIEKVSGMSFD